MYNQPVLSTEQLIPARVQGSGVAEKDEVGCADWVEIQRQVIMHGDLRCANIIIDDSDDAYISGIINGQEGWTSTY